ncbi:hypothetical protein O181_000876 [Austropuccinia psidii MF-1]|uniref:Integrase catalytic domain-containing protein n=1 Tax=Austropuccinia psidii MF-1 TaxID=1389203 RepID=A0A9Q3B9B2_9BASI|nr:hypothetical protein [Austropuccinia psidii MF-1]
MIQIQEPKSPWEIAHMYWVTALPPGGDRSFNVCLVLGDRYRKTKILLPCHKDDTAMETAIMIWNRVIGYTGLFQKIISDRDPKFTSTLWTNLNNLFEKNLSFSTADYPLTNNLEEMIRRFCDYGPKLKDSNGFTHYWCFVIPSLELEYKTSIHSSTGKTPEILEKVGIQDFLLILAKRT